MVKQIGLNFQDDLYQIFIRSEKEKATYSKWQHVIWPDQMAHGLEHRPTFGFRISHDLSMGNAATFTEVSDAMLVAYLPW